MTSYAYNELNSLIRRDDVDYSYDKRGNLIRETKDGATLKSYEWNKTGKLTSVTTPAGKSEYSYDGTGRMLSYKGYTYGKDKSLNLTKDEKYIPFYPSAIDLPFTEEFRKVTHVYGPEGEVGTYADYVMYSFTKDRLLSTRLVSDPKGEAVVAKDFSAYGEPIDVFTREDLVDNNVNKARYTGHVYDDIAGLYYAKARTYDPTDKRFTSLDPVMDGLNWYEYCRSNPLKYTDPTGNNISGNGNKSDKLKQTAEEDIAKNTGTAQYTGVMYLNNENSVMGAGHVAIMLCRSDGTGDLYSFVGTRGRQSRTALKDSEYNDANVDYAYGEKLEDFMTLDAEGKYSLTAVGRVNSDGNREFNDKYTRGIYFPIKHEDGVKILEKVKETMNQVNNSEKKDNPDYHLLTNNCDIQARKWLKAGGIVMEEKPIDKTKSDSSRWGDIGEAIGEAERQTKELWAKRPNATYEYNVEQIEKKQKNGELPGVLYGDLNDIWKRMPHSTLPSPYTTGR